MPSLLPHEVSEVFADVEEAFDPNQQMPAFNYVDQRKNAYAMNLWAALLTGDAFAHGATARQHDARVSAIEKKRRQKIAAYRADVFECEHQAALALHATEAAAAAQDAVKVFKAHKRAGKFAWQATLAKNKLWQLGYERERACHIWPHRVREVLQAVANAQDSWVQAGKIWWKLDKSRLAARGGL